MNDRRAENQEPLDALLRQWTVEAGPPPRFQEQVWQGIARAEARRAPGFRAGLLRLVEVVLPRPEVAFGYVAALLVLGIAAGSFAAQLKSNRLQATLGLRYVQSLDPYRAGDSPP
ncbi:MAG: hypothetical protein ABSH34_15435 [Verrucomicrobiota bacterium]|jgi:hypothetical protein